MGKSRLTPLKPVTIPRMELSAAVLSTRLDRMIRQELDLSIDNSFFWTDSTCVLCYIGNDERRYKTFVANRVATICEQTSPRQWKYMEQRLTPTTTPQESYWPTLSSKCPEFLWLCERLAQSPTVVEREIKEMPNEEESIATFATMSCPAKCNIMVLFKQFSLWSIFESIFKSIFVVQFSSGLMCRRLSATFADQQKC